MKFRHWTASGVWGMHMASPMSSPQVSIVVRSYNRVPALCELLVALLGQRHDSFEIVVVEQSTEVPLAARAELDRLASDPRVRLLRHPPLGGPRARNVGVEAARGEFVLFIDDDDLPVGDGWIAAHLACYEDPDCLGVTGRHVSPDDPGKRYAFPISLVAYRRCQMFSPLLKLPWTYVRHDRRKVPVDNLHGTNASLRRSAFERFGGWDTDTRIEDEASFCLRAARLKRPAEYFAFDPRPVVARRMGLGGGLALRRMTAGRYFHRRINFVHRILFRYHRARVIGLYPLYVLAMMGWTLLWIWDESVRYDTAWKRLGATLALPVTVPYHAVRSLLLLPKGLEAVP